MDPKICLLTASEALASGNYCTALELCAEYRGWRRKGGYEPQLAYAGGRTKDGGAVAKEIQTAAWAKRQERLGEVYLHALNYARAYTTKEGAEAYAGHYRNLVRDDPDHAVSHADAFRAWRTSEGAEYPID